jgi:hypothetical protein
LPIFSSSAERHDQNVQIAQSAEKYMAPEGVLFSNLRGTLLHCKSGEAPFEQQSWTKLGMVGA